MREVKYLDGKYRGFCNIDLECKLPTFGNANNSLLRYLITKPFIVYIRYKFYRLKIFNNYQPPFLPMLEEFQNGCDIFITFSFR